MARPGPDLPLDWPADVREKVGRFHSRPLDLQELSGPSRRPVYRLRWTDGSAILKLHANPNEVYVYQRLAPTLGAAGIMLPRLYASGPSWLLLEDIPAPLPQERWQADPEVLGILRRLHALALPPGPDPFRPQWTGELTDAALSLFPPAVAEQIAPPLRETQAACQALFRPLCPISGDPNPSNWGLRADGRPVLFDWERFGYGTPALDLAITVPGLGSSSALMAVATCYLQEAGPAAERLCRDMAAAKLWTAVEFLSMYAAGRHANAESVGHLVRLLPEWVRRLRRQWS